jgi:single-stranded-DNA-specific exonuclease
MKWHIQSPLIPKKLAELEEILLKNRSIPDRNIFFKSISPFTITIEELGIDQKELAKIKKRLKQAKKLQEKIIIFGDYDADGISATAVLWQVLHALGYQVLPFIPNRLKHGYGLSTKALRDLLKEQPDVSLIITVDNGIVAHRALDFLHHKGIEVIISDHHQSDEEAIQALAVFHSTQVCGCAVAWFLAREIAADQHKDLLSDLLALVAIATVTDLMPLLSFNRVLLVHGLMILRTNRILGLKKLLSKAAINPDKIDAYTLGFQIGPRINAMGRLANGMDALRLLCTQDEARAEQLSDLLQSTNENRQNLTFDLTNQAVTLVEQEPNEKLIFLSSAEYHEGIIGLIAGKMTEKFSRPSIVVSIGKEVSKASARSLAGFNITEFIRSFKEDLLEVGGHPLAAGFALETQKITAVKTAMQNKAQELLAEKNLEKTLEVETVLPASFLTSQTIALIDQFAPFGLANPKPIFVLENVLLKNYRLLGNKQEHLKLIITCDNQEEYEVLAWGQAALVKQLQINERFDFAVTLELNVYRDIKKVQLVLRDFKKPKPL